MTTGTVGDGSLPGPLEAGRPKGAKASPKRKGSHLTDIVPAPPFPEGGCKATATKCPGTRLTPDQQRERKPCSQAGALLNPAGFAT